MKSKETKNKIVPKMRFPEFRDAGEWEEYQLGTLFSERQETGFINLPLLSLTEKEGIIPQEKTKRKNNSNSDKSKYLRVYHGDIAYNTMRMWEGRSAFVNIEGLVSPAYTVCKPNDKIDSLFFSYYFKTQQLIQQFHKYSQGFVNDTLNLKFISFSTIWVTTPLKCEQQKIADCLSSTDELINVQSRKLEVLKVHKKGLMQQLFPAEGETAPKLRFPKFRDAGEWANINGNKAFEHIANRNHSLDLPILAISQEYGAIPRNKIDYNVIVSEQSIENYKVVEIGDFIISLRSFQGGIEYSNYKGLCSPAYIILRKKNNNIVNHFFRHYFKTEKYIQNLNRNIEGIRDGKMVSYKQFSEILLPIPRPAEQQKIADCLSFIDKLIIAQSYKLETLKVHKKGLMQQLFPTMSDFARRASISIENKITKNKKISVGDSYQ
jgi:type I restriction enzyme S subunit